MTAKECILNRRSIRKFRPENISHDLLESIIETASYAPSWKHTQTIRYIAIEGETKDLISKTCYTTFPSNGLVASEAPMLIAITVLKGRCGFERDGSFTTYRGDSWQMFDAGIASQTFCLACHEQGLGSVIHGIFDETQVTTILGIPDDRELVALIPIGYPAEEPTAPRRKSVDDLLLYM